LSIARFPILVRPFAEGYVEPIRMANRSPEPLGDFISRIRNEKGLSCTDVSKQSARFGKPISASYVNRIENKRIKDPSPDRLRALAYGLGIPAEDLLARAAGLVAPGDQSEELHLVTRFRELSPDRRVVVLNIWICFIRSSRPAELHVRDQHSKRKLSIAFLVAPFTQYATESTIQQY
jgi:transcriptional regulator with XRE-family HTH domain